jgi:sporulation protein YlmC with PRC-barrel domain
MIINEQTLIRLPVFTRSGDKLGHVIDIEFDTENHAVRKYLVGARFQKEIYLVAPVQVIEIGEEKIVVEDGVTKDPVVADLKKQILPRGLDTAMPRTTD